MKNRKKIFLLIVLILICLLIYSIIQIYARYLSTANSSSSFTVANWNILVNNTSIKNNTDISNVITPIFTGNENIANGIIAPTAEGYFDLNLDFSEVDVSFEYNINTSANSNSSVQDLVATGYSIDDGEKITFETFNESISDTILLKDDIKSRKIRIYILWNDDESTQTMDNSADTLSTSSENPPLFDVSLSFKQIPEAE